MTLCFIDFPILKKNKINGLPYSNRPVVLNVYLTMNCNLDCSHCVSKDFGQVGDSVIFDKLIQWINKERFLVVVVTGGEPFLPQYESQLKMLLSRISNKGIVIDTNGTIFPSDSLITAAKAVNALIRVSWDSTNVYEEIKLRHFIPNSKKNRGTNNRYYEQKINMIRRLIDAGLNVGVQSVLHKANLNGIARLPDKLKALSIKKWYIQRFIPAHKAISKSLELPQNRYDLIVNDLELISRSMNIDCVAKKDRRHNCVVMLVGEMG